MEKEKYVLMIDGNPFEYNGYHITYETVNTITFEKAKNILFILKNKFDEKGLSFFLIFGTLLGAIRENNFISHDYDIDVATEDFDQMLKYIPEWYEEGFKICRHNSMFLSFMIDDVYIDVYRFQKSTQKRIYRRWCCQIDYNIIPKRFFKEFIYTEFLGDRFLIPRYSKELLRWMYGKKWETPIKGAHGRYDVWPEYYRKKLSPYIGRKKIKSIIKRWF